MWTAVEYSLIAVWGILVITQMLIPALTGRPFFPMFRREHDLREEIKKLEQEAKEEELAREIKRRKAAEEQCEDESE